MPDSPSYIEDLRQIAADAYKLSDRLCGACRDQHALWTYLRLSRASTGAEGQQSKLEAQLAGLFESGLRDVLIAGAQDTGLLALVARAGAGRKLNIVVLDVCETPLELCRRLAAQWSLSIETVRQDLIDFDLAGRFDAVLMHGTLNFIAADHQPEVLARLRRALRPSSRLVLLFNTGRMIAPEAAAVNHAAYADFVLSELEHLGVPLPASEAVMRARLKARARQRELRDRSFAGPQEVEALLTTAGFVVDNRTRSDVDLAGPVDTMLATFSKQRHMFVARPQPPSVMP